MNKREIEKAILRLKDMLTHWYSNGLDDEEADAMRLAKEALEHQLTNGWIPAPPPMGTECTVQTTNDEVIQAYYAGDKKYHFAYHYDRVILADVKYWQPLPEPMEVSDAEGN